MPVCRLACLTNAGLTLPPIRPPFQQAGLFRCLHDRFEPCLAYGKPAGRRLAMNGLYLPEAIFGRASHLLAPARRGFAC